MMTAADYRRAQTLLANLGFYIGNIDGLNGPLTRSAVQTYQHEKGGLTVDGIIGPKTWAAMFPEVAQTGAVVTRELLNEMAPHGRRSIMEALVDPMVRWLPEAGVTTPLRLAHFLGQAAEETDDFHTLVEYWGPTRAQRGYEGRRDLGNIMFGDGPRFKGRGIFQITGRSNYAGAGLALGIDLEARPELAADPETAVRTACWYWRSRNINPLADADDVWHITHAINGGTNGLAQREEFTARAKRALGI